MPGSKTNKGLTSLFLVGFTAISSFIVLDFFGALPLIRDADPFADSDTLDIRGHRGIPLGESTSRFRTGPHSLRGESGSASGMSFPESVPASASADAPVLTWHGIEASHIDTGSITSRTIEDGTIRGRDIDHDTDIEVEAITAKHGSFQTISAGTWNASMITAAYGGTGLDASSAADGTLLIGNGSGYTLATLTEGAGITVTNGAGSIAIASTLGTSIEGAEISDATIEEVDLASTNAPTDGYILAYDDATGGFTWVVNIAGKFTDAGTYMYLNETIDDLVLGSSTTDSGFFFDVSASTLSFEGTTADAYETMLAVADPTADRTVTLPNVTGTVVTTGNLSDITAVGTVASGTWNGTALTDSYIDFGTGAGQISASDLPINDFGGYFSGVTADTNEVLQHIGREIGERWSSGIVSGGVITPSSGNTIDITAGVGYIGSIRITWDAFSGVAMTQDGDNWVSIDANGAVRIDNTEPSIDDHIRLGYVYTVAGNTAIGLHASAPSYAGNYESRNNHFVSKAIGAIVETGNIVGTTATPLGIQATSGEVDYNLKDFHMSDTSTFTKWYDSADNGWVTDTADNLVNTTRYNDTGNNQAGALVSMTAGYWKKDLILRTLDGNLHYIYGQAEYATEQAAKDGALPSIPGAISTSGSVYLATAVVQNGDTTLANRLYDIRPNLARVFGFGTSGTTGAIATHSALADLTSDDHQQYLLTNGGRLMTGNLQMNSNAITGVTNLTMAGLLQNTRTTEQMRLRYDASNYASFTVGSTGVLTIGATGLASSGTVTFSGLSTAGIVTNTAGGVLGTTSTIGVALGGTGTSTAFTQGSVVFAGASGTYAQDNASFFWDDTNNRLGLGDATPDAKLDLDFASTSGAAGTEYGQTITVSDTGVVTTGADNTYGEHVSVTRTGATGGSINAYGLFAAAALDNAGSGSGTAYGVYGRAGGSAGSPADSAVGVQGIVTGASGIGNGYALRASAVVAGTGIDTAYGLYVESFGDATIANYGVYIEDQTVGASPLSYALYSAGGQSYHAGNFGVGDTTPAALFTVGNGDLFQINSSGAIAAATGITSSGSITFSGLSAGGVVQAASGTGLLSVGTLGASGITADSLDFTEFQDQLDLDASTDILADSSEVFSITNTGTGNSFVVNDQAGDTTPFVIDAYGRVSITRGTVSDSTNSLAVSSTRSADSNGGNILSPTNNINSALTVTPTADDAGIFAGIASKLTLTGSVAYSGSMIGVDNYVKNNSAAALDSMYGDYNRVEHNSNAVVTNAFGSYNDVYNGSTTSNTVTNAYGVYSSVDGTASFPDIITNGYGLYVSMDTVNITNPYAVYTSGGANSYFDGNVGIGDTTPDGKLDIDLASTSATANMIYGSNITVSDTGIVTAGTDATYGIYSSLTRTGATGGTIDSYGIFNKITASNAGTGTSAAYGLYNDMSEADADTVYGVYNAGGTAATEYGVWTGMGTSVTTAWYGFYADSGINGLGAASASAYGVYVDSLPLAGNAYGVYVDSMGSGANDYAFYAAGPTDKSYIGGILGIGTTTPTTGSKLSISTSSTSTTAGALYGSDVTVSDTGVVTTGTDTTYGSYVSLTRTGATGGTLNNYGGYATLTGTFASGTGTINNYGQYATVSGNTTGTSTNYGSYVAATGADTNYGSYALLTPTAGTTSYGFAASMTDTTTTGNTLYGNSVSITDTGVVTTGTDTVKGEQITIGRTGATGGTINVTGQEVNVTADAAGTGTLAAIGSSLSVFGGDSARGLNVTSFGGSGTTAVYGADISVTGFLGGSGVATYGIKVFSSGVITGGNGTIYGIHSTTSTTSATDTAYALYADAGTGTGTEYAGVFMNGNVGIGTAAPNQKLHVAGNINISTGSSYMINGGTALYINSGTGGVNVGLSNTQSSSGVAVGSGNTANNAISTAIGASNTATGAVSVAQGYGNVSSGTNSAAIGFNNTSSGLTSAAIGYGNTASANNAVAMGMNVSNGTASSLMIGASDTAKLTILSTNYVGLGTITPATRLDVSGLTLNTDANGTVGAANFTYSLTKNDTNTRAFSGLSIVPTLNAGASNANTTLNILKIDTTNTAVTGVTTNLIKASYGGVSRFVVDSAGNVTSTIGQISGADGLVTKVNAGACDDATFTLDTDGNLCIDSVNGRIYYRYGGAWHYSAQTAGFQIPDYEAYSYDFATDSFDEDRPLVAGDFLMPFVETSMEDGALHGLYAKWSDVKGELFAEEKAQIDDLSLKTDQSVTTLGALQASVDTQLEVIGDALAVLGAESGTTKDSITALDSRVLATETATTAIQAQIAGHDTTLASLETQMATLSAQNQVIMDFFTVLDLDSVVVRDQDGNVDLLEGKIRARLLETGGIVVENVDENAPTIGTATIYPVAVDADGDGDDDWTDLPMADATVAERDGKSVIVETAAVSGSSRIFVTAREATDQPLAVTDRSDEKYFTVELKGAAEEPIPFDWWVVRESN